jgi:hypothetical protein
MAISLFTGTKVLSFFSVDLLNRDNGGKYVYIKN